MKLAEAAAVNKSGACRATNDKIVLASAKKGIYCAFDLPADIT
jgi:hypothetical protein